MAKKMTQSVSNNPGMMLVTTYVVLFLVNAVVIHLAGSLFPRQIVLGTMSSTWLWAVLHSVGVLTLIDTFAIPFARMMEQYMGRMLTPREWMIKYFFLNFISLWFIARFSDQFGLGITHWYVIAILALVLDFVQGVAMMSLSKTQSK